MDLSKSLRDRWVQAQLALLAVLGAAGPLVPRMIGPSAGGAVGGVGPWAVRVIGVLLCILGLAFAGWSARSLGPALTPEPEPLPEARLVERGPYAVMRHPIYAGVVLAMAGWTLAWSNWVLATAVGLVLAGFFEAKARVEEQWLRARFPGYTDYARRVRRRVIWTDSARVRPLP